MNGYFTVLIADDDENDLYLFRSVLRKMHPTAVLRHVVNGQEVIGYLKGNGTYSDRRTYPFPNCLVLDLKMPLMNGLEVLVWLRRHPQYRVVPTVILSSSVEPQDVKEALDLGAHDYFLKPIDTKAREGIVKKIHEYWLLVSAMPRPQPHRQTVRTAIIDEAGRF